MSKGPMKFEKVYTSGVRWEVDLDDGRGSPDISRHNEEAGTFLSYEDALEATIPIVRAETYKMTHGIYRNCNSVHPEVYVRELSVKGMNFQTKEGEK